jgi:ElaB/YqjD/DUF883 family membrane-anchored ribosome-binding protein
VVKSDLDALHKQPTQEPRDFNELLTVQQHVLEEYTKANDVKKRKFREELMRDLNEIRGSLQDMLNHNNNVAQNAPLEELERDEFVIDVAKKEKLWEHCMNVCQDIRNEAEQNILKV